MLKMERNNKPSSSELVSKQIISAKGRLVGTVKDVFLKVGKTGYSLSVERQDGETQTIEWEDVQGASDFILLKPVSQSTHELRSEQKISQMEPQAKQSGKPLCPTCGKPLKWIPQYNRWYCNKDKKYV
jgi:sporulation protein YlmC with PRC-barrel domain